ncbi:MAG: KOW motif-containing protein [Fusobacteria bacterium]|nr:KOW motif-containing protein [Fusobacteriota bacterium]
MTNTENKWYVIHTYSGYEKKVKADLEKKIENDDFLKSKVFNVSVPEEDIVEVKKGKQKTIQKKLYTSYVMIEMEVEKIIDLDGYVVGHRVDSDVWYIVRNTIGVTGFVGIGTDPIPLDDDEVEKMGLSDNENKESVVHHLINLTYSKGSMVTIVSGAFAGNSAEVLDIDLKNQKVKVEITLFGRKTPVELNLDEVEIY